MAFTIVISSSQSDFNARSAGSCWGISFIFCMRALEADAISGLKSMLAKKAEVEVDAEAMMVRQGQILGQAASSYVRDATGKAEGDLGTAGGFQNQNVAIQARHTAVGTEVLRNKQKCIGTLSSFFEGGTKDLIAQILRLLKKSGVSAAQIGLQGGGAHSVALSWDGAKLYFFDPNDGVAVADDKDDVPALLAVRFAPYKFLYAHIYKKA
jgi:hypothetical protein